MGTAQKLSGERGKHHRLLQPNLHSTPPPLPPEKRRGPPLLTSGAAHGRLINPPGRAEYDAARRVHRVHSDVPRSPICVDEGKGGKATEREERRGEGN